MEAHEPSLKPRTCREKGVNRCVFSEVCWPREASRQRVCCGQRARHVLLFAPASPAHALGGVRAARLRAPRRVAGVERRPALLCAGPPLLTGAAFPARRVSRSPWASSGGPAAATASASNPTVGSSQATRVATRGAHVPPRPPRAFPSACGQPLLAIVRAAPGKRGAAADSGRCSLRARSYRCSPAGTSR